MPRRWPKRWHSVTAPTASPRKADYQTFAERIQSLVNTPDLDPVTFLGFERQTPYSGPISAPYRLDCALTYRTTQPEDQDIAPQERVDRELSSPEWVQIINKAWEIGIPHIVFTGGEPTLHKDLPQLIAAAEANGQVTGLLTDGVKLADQAYLLELLQTGLNHLMIILDPKKEIVWQALENALAEDIFVAVHLTLSEPQVDGSLKLCWNAWRSWASKLSRSVQIPKNWHRNWNRFVRRLLSCSSIWFGTCQPPTQPCTQLPWRPGLSQQPQGAGTAFLYLEPDGDVLPAQGVNQVLGNFLNDPWETLRKGLVV